MLNVYKLLFKCEWYRFVCLFIYFWSPLGSEHFHEMAPGSLHGFWKVAEIGHTIRNIFQGLISIIYPTVCLWHSLSPHLCCSNNTYNSYQNIRGNKNYHVTECPPYAENVTNIFLYNPHYPKGLVLSSSFYRWGKRRTREVAYLVQGHSAGSFTANHSAQL